MVLISDTDDTSEEDSSQNIEVPTHARVKYVEDGSVSIIKVNQILEFQRAPPQNIEDFNKKKIYSTIYKDAKNPLGIKQPILVSDLAVFKSTENRNTSELSKMFKSRCKFPKLNDSDLAEYYEKEEESELSEKEKVQDTVEEGTDNIKKEEEKRKAKAHKKSLQKIFQKNQSEIDKNIIKKKLLTLDNVTKLTYTKNNVKESCSSTKDDKSNTTQLNEAVDQGTERNCKLSIEIKQLKQKLKERDEDLAAEKVKVQQSIEKETLHNSKLRIEVGDLRRSLDLKDLELTKKEIQIKNLMEQVNELKRALSNYERSTETSTFQKQLASPSDSSARRNLFSRGESWMSQNQYNESEDLFNENLNEQHEHVKSTSAEQSPSLLFKHTKKKKRVNSPLGLQRESSMSQNQYNESEDLFNENLNEQHEHVKSTSAEQSPSSLSKHTKKGKRVNSPLGLQTPVSTSTNEVRRRYLKDSNIENIENIEKSNDDLEQSPIISRNLKRKIPLVDNETPKKRFPIIKKKKKTLNCKITKDDIEKWLKLETRKPHEVFNVETDKGERRMIHLHYGYTMEHKTWSKVRDQKTDALFVKKLAVALWGYHNLINRAVDLDKVNISVPGRSPRHPLTPKKQQIMQNCYEHYLNNHNLLKPNMNNKERERKIKGWRRTLGQYINYLITSEIQSGKVDTEEDHVREIHTEENNSDENSV